MLEQDREVAERIKASNINSRLYLIAHAPQMPSTYVSGEDFTADASASAQWAIEWADAVITKLADEAK